MDVNVLLQDAVSQDPTRVQHATAQLSASEKQPGFHLALLVCIFFFSFLRCYIIINSGLTQD